MLKRLKRVVIKEELLAITGDITEAVILNQFIYWSERVYDFDEFIKEEYNRQIELCNKKGSENIAEFPLLHGWIYKSASTLKEELMDIASERTISRKIDSLVEKGYLDRRSNPDFQFDRKYQYRVNFHNIIRALSEKGYSLEGYKVDFSEFQNTINNNPVDDEKDKVKNEKEFIYENGQKGIDEGTSTPKPSSIQTEINELNNIIHISDEDLKGFYEFIYSLELHKLKNKYFDYKEAVESALMDLYFCDDMMINKRCVPKMLIREKLKRLNIFTIEYAIENFINASKEVQIKYPKAYLKVCIYNSVDEMDIDFKSRVNYDLNSLNEDITSPKESNVISNIKNFEEKEPLYERYKGSEFECVIESIRKIIGNKPAYKTFFDSIISLKRKGETVYIVVQDVFFKNILENRYKDILLEAFNKINIKNVIIQI
ncbi:MAG: hypothetical protein N2448_06050 [Caloramator sp.]|nr:hypothetical protein [Caloramator sp.]